MTPNKLQHMISGWHHSRDSPDEDEIFRVDSECAARCGLPVLAAPLDLRRELGRAKGSVSQREIEAHLAPIMIVAVREATVRLVRIRAQVGNVPNVPTITEIVP